MKLTPVSTPLSWACMDHYRQGERTAQSQRTPRNTQRHTHRDIHVQKNKEVYTDRRNENVHVNTWNSFLRGLYTYTKYCVCLWRCVYECIPY